MPLIDTKDQDEVKINQQLQKHYEKYIEESTRTDIWINGSNRIAWVCKLSGLSQ